MRRSARAFPTTQPAPARLRCRRWAALLRDAVHRGRVVARTHLEEGLGLAGELGDRYLVSLGLNALAELHRAQGDLASAQRFYEEALALDRELGDHLDIAINLVNLARAEVGRQAGGRARETLLEALAIAEVRHWLESGMPKG